jgi:regulator of sigma E protease
VAFVSTVTHWVFVILGLGIIVFVHELGHFIAAKANGIEVEVFSLGWGRKLFGASRGGTLYQVAWFPIGGYCKMKGEMLRSDMTEERLAELRSEPGSFLAASPWRRFVVAAAGPVANIISAVLILTLIWWVGFAIRSTDPRIILQSTYAPAGTVYPADKGGLRTGDRIVAIDGKAIQSFWEISEAVHRSAERPMRLTVERDGDRLALTVVPERDAETRLGRLGIRAWFEPRVARVESGSPAERAGLRPGDLITAVGDSPVPHDAAFLAAVVAAKNAGDAVIAYRRNNEQRTTTLALDTQRELATGIRFATKVYRSPRLGLAEAAATGLRQTGEFVSLQVLGLRQLFKMRGKTLPEVIVGPARIAEMIGGPADTVFNVGVGAGVVEFVQIVVVLSIAIAIMNLLPLPALDGGLIVISVAEALARRRLGPRLLWRYQVAGAIVVFSLIFLAVASDILFYVG